jgi:hypothetical protein
MRYIREYAATGVTAAALGAVTLCGPASPTMAGEAGDGVAQSAEAATAYRYKNWVGGKCVNAWSNTSVVTLHNCSYYMPRWYVRDKYRKNGSWWFQLSNAATGKCLGVSGGSTASGVPLATGRCNGRGDASQFWRFKHLNSAKTRSLMINMKSKMCVGTRGSSGATGTRVIQGRCYTGSGTTQIWRIQTG